MPKRSKKKFIIAIDGPAGSGKSSTAKALKLNFIDTGAMYRAVTLKAIQQRLPFTEKKKLIAIAKKARIELKGTNPLKQQVFLDGKNVTKAIRTPELTKNVFHVAQEPMIRREMVKKQRAMGKAGGAVMEGRDIGTKVFPNADYKFYFDASHEIRASRRLRELLAEGKKAKFADVLADIKRRDKTDIERKEGPLRQAKDAIFLDTTSLTIDETVDRILDIMKGGQ
jgi:CMP/dCMP kinase